jgi:hypothetical protein
MKKKILSGDCRERPPSRKSVSPGENDQARKVACLEAPNSLLTWVNQYASVPKVFFNSV